MLLPLLLEIVFSIQPNQLIHIVMWKVSKM